MEAYCELIVAALMVFTALPAFEKTIAWIGRETKRATAAHLDRSAARGSSFGGDEAIPLTE